MKLLKIRSWWIGYQPIRTPKERFSEHGDKAEKNVTQEIKRKQISKRSVYKEERIKKSNIHLIRVGSGADFRGWGPTLPPTSCMAWGM